MGGKKPTLISFPMNNIEFQKILDQSTKPLIVEFWASWCAPCKITKPILDGLAKVHANEIRFEAIDADFSREIIQKYKIMGIPSIIVFKNGEITRRITGAKSKNFYEDLFRSVAHDDSFPQNISSNDRVIRLTSSSLLIALGISLSNWILLSVGGIIGFWGIYDRCPIWAQITKWISRKS